jgi:hypothetical protein
MTIGRYCLLALTALASCQVQAFECFEPSPAYARLGDSYFDNSQGRINVSGDEAGLQVLKSLQGDWDGTLSELICEGDEAALEVLYREAEVEAEILPSNTALLLLSLSKEYLDSHLIEGDKVFLLNKGSMYSLRISDEYISAVERERRNWGPRRRGSHYVEVMSDLTLHSDDAITVEWSMFSNGVFVFSQRLRLKRGL